MQDQADSDKNEEEAYRAEQRRIRLARQSADAGLIASTRRVLVIALVIAGINALAAIWNVPDNARTDTALAADAAASANARREADPTPLKKEKSDSQPAADAAKARDCVGKDEGTLKFNAAGSVYLIRVISSLVVFALILLGTLIALRSEADR